MKATDSITELLTTMATLRGPKGCPWDREQDHKTLRWHGVEEMYELVDAIESGDDHEIAEELGDVLLQVVFHCQVARERGAYDFSSVAKMINDKLIRRHPHVFGSVKVKDVDEVWANWEKIKKGEKAGTSHARESVFDGIPKHLPALMRAEKLLKKAKRARIETKKTGSSSSSGPGAIGRKLFELAQAAHDKRMSAEDLLRKEIVRREKAWRKLERKTITQPTRKAVAS
jgi:MazG family protein